MCRSSQPQGTHAVVEVLGERADRKLLECTVGQQLTFGRLPDCDVSLNISEVSRRHGLVFVGAHFVTVTRLPGTSEVWVDQGDVEGPTLIEPGRTVAVDEPSARVHIRTSTPDLERARDLFGTPVFAVHVLQPLDHHSEHGGGADHRAASTAATVYQLRQDPHHPILVALCERLLGSDATHQLDLPGNQEIAARLAERGYFSYKPVTVRNSLSTWRQKLGLPRTKTRNCHCSVAVAAVQTGLVNREDVAAFQRRRPLTTAH